MTDSVCVCVCFIYHLHGTHKLLSVSDRWRSMSTSTDDFVTYIQRKRNKGQRWKKKDARMKVYVKKKRRT